MPQGDFDGVIEAYRHALDAFLKLMIEVATGEAGRRAAPSDYCQHWNAKPRSAVVPLWARDRSPVLERVTWVRSDWRMFGIVADPVTRPARAVLRAPTLSRRSYT